MRALRPTAALATLTAVAALSVAVLPLTPASAGSTGARACPPAARALGFSDRLDKVVHDGVTLGGLSDLDRDRRSHALVSSVDNHGSDPARLWFFPTSTGRTWCAIPWCCAGVANLSSRPGLVMRKRLVADVTACPTLGATSNEPQTNPLMDNYEGMHVARARRGYRVTLVSDDNLSQTQKTRVLRLAARLP